jgi:hypothetical protein
MLICAPKQGAPWQKGSAKKDTACSPHVFAFDLKSKRSAPAVHRFPAFDAPRARFNLD